MLSVKGCRIAQTTRMLAQKQPPFEECVIAHWSSDPAPTMYRGLSVVPKLEDPQGSVEERSAGSEAARVTGRGACRSENVGMSSVISVRNRDTVSPRVPTQGYSA